MKMLLVYSGAIESENFAIYSISTPYYRRLVNTRADFGRFFVVLAYLLVYLSVYLSVAREIAGGIDTQLVRWPCLRIYRCIYSRLAFLPFYSMKKPAFLGAGSCLFGWGSLPLCDQVHFLSAERADEACGGRDMSCRDRFVPGVQRDLGDEGFHRRVQGDGDFLQGLQCCVSVDVVLQLLLAHSHFGGEFHLCHSSLLEDELDILS